MKEQVLITMDVDEFRSIIREEVRAEVDAAIERLSPRKELPHFLTVNETKDLLRVSHSKMYELIGRPGFPICRDFGVRIYTDKLFKWIEDNMENS